MAAKGQRKPPAGGHYVQQNRELHREHAEYAAADSGLRDELKRALGKGSSEPSQRRSPCLVVLRESSPSII
jgi:hypothetical protein